MRAAAVVLMEAGAAAKRGIDAAGRLVAYAHSGVEPGEMGIGPVPAVRRILARAGLSVADLDVIESNEAFAAQAWLSQRSWIFRRSAPIPMAAPSPSAIPRRHRRHHYPQGRLRTEPHQGPLRPGDDVCVGGGQASPVLLAAA